MRPMSHLTGVQLLHNHGSMLLYQPCWTLYLAVQHWLLKLKILLSTKHSSASLASDHIKLRVKITQLSTEHFIASLASGHSKLQVNNQALQGFRLQLTRGGRLMFISLLVILAAVMWTFTAGSAGSALNFCKGLWKSSSR